MFDDLIITGTDKIIKFLRKLDIDIFLTTPQLKHVMIIPQKVSVLNKIS